MGAANTGLSPLIILAGGKGSRLGIPKGLIEYNGRPWLQNQLKEAAECGITRVVVVLGHEKEAYFSALPWLVSAQDRRFDAFGIQVSVVVNPRPELGPFSSLQAGAEFLCKSDAQAAFVLPVDVPVASIEVWRMLQDALVGEALASAPIWQKRGGHPVLLSRVLLDKILSLSLDAASARLDVLLHKLSASEFARVEVDDPKVGMNINTLEDWRGFVA